VSFKEFLVPDRFQDQVSIITGGASGIGKAIALRFAREGSSVAIADKNVDAASLTVKEIEETGGKVLFLKCDVSSAKDVRNMVDATLEHYGKINILINNAGITIVEDFFTMTEESWDKEIAVDLTSVILCIKYVVPAMIKTGGGTIVNISSICGLTGIGLKGIISPAYVAAKGGVVSLTKKLAGELAPYNITINTICPGFIETAFNEEIRQTDLGKKIQEKIPRGRWGKTKDIASVTAFLASAEADFMTGSIMQVDGGMSSFLEIT